MCAVGAHVKRVCIHIMKLMLVENEWAGYLCNGYVIYKCDNVACVNRFKAGVLFVVCMSQESTSIRYQSEVRFTCSFFIIYCNVYQFK